MVEQQPKDLAMISAGGGADNAAAELQWCSILLT
jgi:hypothetical protein